MKSEKPNLVWVKSVWILRLKLGKLSKARSCDNRFSAYREIRANLEKGDETIQSQIIYTPQPQIFAELMKRIELLQLRFRIIAFSPETASVVRNEKKI